jgi:hypothetical protein
MHSMQSCWAADFFVYTLTFDMGSSFEYNAASDAKKNGGNKSAYSHMGGIH